MNRPLRLLAVLLPAFLVTPAHADPGGTVDTGFTLQGRIDYACYGCGLDATFTGVATWLDDDGQLVTVPGTGTFNVDETCGDAGGLYGTLQLGDEFFDTSVTRHGGVVTILMFGPGGFYHPDTGGGTLTLDDSSRTCGSGPATASLTAVLAPFTNCYCTLG